MLAIMAAISCISGGYWDDTKPWKDMEQWKD